MIPMQGLEERNERLLNLIAADAEACFDLASWKTGCPVAKESFEALVETCPGFEATKPPTCVYICLNEFGTEPRDWELLKVQFLCANWNQVALACQMMANMFPVLGRRQPPDAKFYRDECVREVFQLSDNVPLLHRSLLASLILCRLVRNAVAPSTDKTRRMFLGADPPSARDVSSEEKERSRADDMDVEEKASSTVAADDMEVEEVGPRAQATQVDGPRVGDMDVDEETPSESAQATQVDGPRVGDMDVDEVTTSESPQGTQVESQQATEVDEDDEPPMSPVVSMYIFDNVSTSDESFPDIQVSSDPESGTPRTHPPDELPASATIECDRVEAFQARNTVIKAWRIHGWSAHSPSEDSNLRLLQICLGNLFRKMLARNAFDLVVGAYVENMVGGLREKEQVGLSLVEARDLVRFLPPPNILGPSLFVKDSIVCEVTLAAE